MPDVTTADIVNEALMLVGGNQPKVTGNWPNFAEVGPGETAGKAANILYGPCVETVARQFGWDFARTTAALTKSGKAAPIPWAQQYLYPEEAIQIWHLMPPDPDPFDPLPINFSIANDVIGMLQLRVINTDLDGAVAVYNNNPRPETWDASFRAAVVRLLASEFAMALGGKPDLQASLVNNASAFEQSAENRQD